MIKKAIYARVSSLDQNPARQIKEKGSLLFLDKISGAVEFSKRPAGKKLIKAIEAGQVNFVEISSIDRLGRNAYDIQKTIEYFKANKVQLVVKNQGLFLLNDNGKINPMFKLIADLLANIAEMERISIKERQKEGISIAKINGTYQGRKPGAKQTREQFLLKHKKTIYLLDKGLSIRVVARACDISPATVQKVKNLLNSDPAQITLEQAIEREENKDI